MDMDEWLEGLTPWDPELDVVDREFDPFALVNILISSRLKGLLPIVRVDVEDARMR